ncbi:kinase-like domain-containing protein [Camillea tinctor]|nr:kinase-like domain-containing protein [Camillea tinctor]
MTLNGWLPRQGRTRSPDRQIARYKPPRQSPQQDPHSPSSREPLDTLPYLELRFSDPPRTSSGLVFGTAKTCDVVLPEGHLVSQRHFAITYKRTEVDGRYHLIVKDLKSRYGTVVEYDMLGKDQRRRNFDWIIDGFNLPDAARTLTVNLPYEIRFQIVVTTQNIASLAYIDNVERFGRGAASLQDLVSEYDLQSGPSTEHNSEAQTPAQYPIHLSRGVLGTGGFGTVTLLWNVSTGEEYACKKPTDPIRHNKEAWRREVAVMRRTTNDHIVQLIFDQETPEFCFYMEHMPFGNLDDQHKEARFSDGECVAILHQSTSALKYLHGQREAITHRDIKPENILVKYRHPYRDPNYLCIKLSDFGLAKIGDSLNTGCGTRIYMPPEICMSLPSGYTKAVDIWSLGVVILHIAYKLPDYNYREGLWWCNKIVEAANNQASDGLANLLQRMLVINAEARVSAADCYHEASQLLIPFEDRSATPTQASYTTGHGIGAAHPASAVQEGEEQTLRITSQDDGLDDDLGNDPDKFSDSQGQIRANGRPPDSARLLSASARETYLRSSSQPATRNQPGSDTPEHVAGAGQHPGTGDNMTPAWQDEQVIQHHESESKLASALLGSGQTAPALLGTAGPNASVYLPPHILDPSTTVQPGTEDPNGADGSYSAGNNNHPRPDYIPQRPQHAEPSHVAEGLPTGPPPDRQEEAPSRRRKRPSSPNEDILGTAHRQKRPR